MSSRAALLLLTGSATASCCTKAGCSSGLTVRIRGEIPLEYRVLASTDGQPPVVFECTPGRVFCASGVLLFNDFTPNRGSVRVETSAGVTTKEFTPNYRTFAPNGKDCGPICRIADVEITL